MNLPRPRNIDRQLLLWDRPILSMGETRHAVGTFYERLTAQLTGGVLLRTDSRIAICPDIQFPDGSVAEVKAVGKTGKVILYSGRVEKYRTLGAAGILHAIWIHNCRPSTATTYNELHSLLLANTRELILIDSHSLFAMTDNQPQRVVNTGMRRPGESLTDQTDRQLRTGYFHGWCVPVKQIRAACRYWCFLDLLGVSPRLSLANPADCLLFPPEMISQQ